MPGQCGRVVSLDDVGSMLVARQRPLGEAAVELMRAEIANYGAIEDPGILSDIRAHVEEAFDAMGGYLSSGHPSTYADVGFVREHAALRARKRVSLVDFMHAIRIAHRVMWDAIAEWTADRPGGGEVALHTAGLVIDFINWGSTVAAQAYLDTEQLLAVEGDRVRRDLLEDLLAGRELVPGPRLRVAREMGLTEGAACVLLVAIPVAPIVDDYGLRSAAAALERAVESPMGALTVLRQDEIVIVREAQTEPRDPFSPPVTSAWRRLCDHGVRLAIGISTHHHTLATVAEAYQDATGALSTLSQEGGVVALSDMTAFDYLTLRADKTTERLIPPAVQGGFSWWKHVMRGVR